MSYRPSHHPSRLLAGLTAAALTLGLAACGTSSADDAAKGSMPSKPPAGDLEVVPAIAKLVPEKFRSGIDNGQYNDLPPQEFLQDGELVGIQPEIVRALSQVLGVPIENQSIGTWDSLIPGLLGGRFQISSSDFGVTAERLEQVDFVTEFSLGTAFAVKKGSDIEVKEEADLCGHSVGVLAGSYFVDQVKKVSEECTAAGKEPVEVMTYPTASAQILAEMNGRTEVTAEGQDTLGYTVSSQGLPLEIQELVLDSVPQGIIVDKRSGLGPALEAAMKEIVRNGTYAKILERWNVSELAATEDEIELLTDPAQAPKG